MTTGARVYRLCVHLVAVTGLACSSAIASGAPSVKQPIPSKAQLKACPDFAGFDWPAMAKKGLLRLDPQSRRAAITAEHQQVRGPIALPEIDEAIVSLAIVMRPGETQDSPSWTSAFVWKGRSGAWQVDRVDWYEAGEIVPRSPGETLTPEEADRRMRTHRQGPLNETKSTQLEAALSSPCFAIQPDAPPLFVPMKGSPAAPCYPGAGGALVVTREGADRLIVDPCARWQAGKLMEMVQYAEVSAEQLALEALRSRLGGNFSDELVAVRGQSREVSTDIICGRYGLGRRGAPRRFIVKTALGDGSVKAVAIDNRGNPEFVRLWIDAGCEDALNRPRQKASAS